MILRKLSQSLEEGKQSDYRLIFRRALPARAAAQALRTRDDLVPAPRLRFADIGTVLVNLMDSNAALVDGLREYKDRK